MDHIPFEKRNGALSAQTLSYCERIVPIINGYFHLIRNTNYYLLLMQDGAPGHASKKTSLELQAHHISPFFRPSFSPDLNPIEMARNWMKGSYPMIDNYGLYGLLGVLNLVISLRG